MNESQMKILIPPTVGFLIAGIASGICYLLIGSLRKGKSSKRATDDDGRCACCLKPFLVGRGVECNACGARSCRKGCCRWDSVENSWFCHFCYHNRSWARRGEKWFRSFGGLPVEPENRNNFSTAKSRVYDEGAEHVATHPELDLAAGGRKEGDPMETVREFVEKIVEGLVGNVDDTPIDCLYDHSAYDQLFQTYGEILARALIRLAISLRQCTGNKPATDTPTMAHTALRELVERAVDEARKLPCLGATVSTALQDDSSFSERNYEDLLATAILNKVIEKFQNERIDDNSNVVHRRIRSKHTYHDNETGLDEGVDEGSSSPEPVSQDECSSEESGSRTRRSRLRKEPLSLTIEEQIEEVTTYGSDEEIRCAKMNVLDFRNARRVPFPEFGMDIVDPSQDSSDENEEESNDLAHVDMITPVESWEENWLFQKRKIQTQTEPVSMLVPNPSADYRALIGDRDAEDTSDLSEFSAQSDTESEEDDVVEAINRSVRKSSEIDHKTALDHVENLRENKDIEKSSKNIINDRTIMSTDEKDFPDESKTNNDVKHQNIDEEYGIEKGRNLPENNQENCDKKLAEDSLDPDEYEMKNLEVPKTPASPPKRTSSSYDTVEVLSSCDPQKFNEKLVFVDKIADEKNRKRETARIVSRDEESWNKVEKEKMLSSCDVNENFKSSTINGCREDVPQGLVTNGNDRCSMVVKKILENTSNEEITTTGEAEKIENLGKIPNDSIIETTESQGQSSMRIKVPTTLENSSSSAKHEIELATPPRPGTIAEREHKKWENAAPIENNPYSEENIQKRLLERQYARRSSSDVSGNSTKFPTSPSPPLQIVLGAGRPDYKRFGRDYYINEAKCSNGRNIETGFYTATSRPNSSMSQNSLSTGSEYEHQERTRSIDTESNCSTSSDSRTKIIADSRRNNFEIVKRRGSMPTDGEYRTEISNESTNDDRRQSLNDISRNSYDKVLESERKNTKNAINARLNNHGNFEDNKKSIKRIDLRAYGFENEINAKNDENNISTGKKDRVINKLDLRSFGYESGLRRTQSNNNIDGGTKINSPLRSRKNARKFGLKSISMQQKERSSIHSRDEILTKSTESLNSELEGNSEDFEVIKSAKSVPNIDELCSRFDNKNRKREIGNVRRERNFSEHERCEENGKIDETKDGKTDANCGNIETEKISSLPSVKRLAQAFDRTEEIAPLPVRRPSKAVNKGTRERPTTPEIHIIDTPRQMHSLTARSISREFREGLRQMTCKQTASPTKLIVEQKHRSQKSSPTREIENNDDILIGQGKLKSNIKFWEQMHENS